MNCDFSILVIGCKKHEQIANRYYALANKFWPDSIKNTLFCTDEITDYQVEFTGGKIVSDDSNHFAFRIISGLNHIDSDYVVLLLDDYYFTKTIDSNKVLELIKYLRSNELDYCKLIGLPKCFKSNRGFKGTYHIQQSTHYGISLQPSIWKKESLLEALELCTGASAWEVEAAFSSYQKNHFEQCITFNKNFLNYRNGVLRGKLFPYTNRLLSKNGIEVLSLKKISYFKYFCFSTRQHLSMHLPIWLRKMGKRIGKKAGKKYYSED